MLESIQADRERRRRETWRAVTRHALGAGFALVVGAGITVAVLRMIAEGPL